LKPTVRFAFDGRDGDDLSLTLNTGSPAHRRLGFRLAVVRWTGPSSLSLPSFGSGDPFRTAGKK
jgi:hypothetical protein